MPARTLREAQKALTRETLVDAAQAVFEDKGYVATTVDDIIRRAGASRPTFYAYFDSKALALEAVVQKLQLREEYQLMVGHFSSLPELTIDALHAWFEAYVDFYEKNRKIHQAIHQAQVVDPEFAAAMLRTLEGFIDLWRSAGFVRHPGGDDLRLAALMMFALGDQFMYLWLVQGVSVDRAKATRALAEALYGTITRA